MVWEAATGIEAMTEHSGSEEGMFALVSCGFTLALRTDQANLMARRHTYHP